MYCKKCGTELKDGAKFCSKCGASLDTSKKSDQDNIYKKKFFSYERDSSQQNKNGKIISGVLVAIALILFISVIFAPDSSKILGAWQNKNSNEVYEFFKDNKAISYGDYSFDSEASSYKLSGNKIIWYMGLLAMDEEYKLSGNKLTIGSKEFSRKSRPASYWIKNIIIILLLIAAYISYKKLNKDNNTLVNSSESYRTPTEYGKSDYPDKKWQPDIPPYPYVFPDEKTESESKTFHKAGDL